MSNEFYILKDRLNEALRIRGMLPIELAEATGIQKSSLSRYLKGTNIPRSDKIEIMAEALGVSPAWLLGYGETMPITITPEQAPAKRVRSSAKSEQASPIDLTKLTKINKARLLAYYQALIDSQEEQL